MKFTQYYLDCLSQASYLIGDETTGRAVVVDPRRDVSEYLADAAAEGLSITHVVETHFHADFLSGHLELAAATGAEIVYGAAADATFPHRKVADGERLALGDVVLEFRATPGHTPESISVVVWERPGDTVPYGVLTGDTLFIGDVGRPDLLSSQAVGADELARRLYRSLHDRLLSLPDATRLYPGHGAGSACGKNLSSATVSSIGEQRATNYALQPMSVDEFVAVVTAGQARVPDYFAYDAELNRRPHRLFEPGDARGLEWPGLSAARRAGAVVLDTRPPDAFAAGHLRGSINVGLAGRFAEYAGSVLTPDADIVIAGAPGTGTEARIRLGRIGFDRVVGVVDDIEATLADHPVVVERAARLTAGELAAHLTQHPATQLVDIRGDGERRLGSIDGSVHIPLAALRSRAFELDARRPVVAFCAGGYRSSIAASLLRRLGHPTVSDLIGGYSGWQALSQAA